jgi:hypothetical protein
MTIQLVDGKEIEVDDKGLPVVTESAPAVEPVVAVTPTEPAPEPAAVAAPTPTVPLPALHEERHRRQEAERLASERERELEQYRAQSLAAERVRPVDYGSINSFEEVGQRVQEHIANETAVIKTALSREVALLRYPDYTAVIKESKIHEDVLRDPILARYIASQPMPALAAYEIGLARLAPQREAAAKAAGAQEAAKTMTAKVIKAAEAPITMANAPTSPAPVPAGLTREKAADLTPEEWAALPANVREKLLMGQL